MTMSDEEYLQETLRRNVELEGVKLEQKTSERDMELSKNMAYLEDVRDNIRHRSAVRCFLEREADSWERIAESLEKLVKRQVGS